MKLLVRFNLLFIAIAAGMVVSVWLANVFLEREAEDRVGAQAELMVQTASATRLDAEEQIKPPDEQIAEARCEFPAAKRPD